MKKKGGDGLTFRNNLLTSVLNSGHNNLSAARFRIHVVARQNNIHDYKISEILRTLIGQIIGQGAFRRNSMRKILEAFQIPHHVPGKWPRTHAKEYYLKTPNQHRWENLAQMEHTRCLLSNRIWGIKRS